MCGGGIDTGEGRLPQHIDGVFAVGDARGVEDLYTVPRLGNEKTVAHTVERKTVRRRHACLCRCSRIGVEDRLAEHIVRNTVQQYIVTVEVVHQNAAVGRVSNEEPVIHAIKRKANAGSSKTENIRSIVSGTFRKDRTGRHEIVIGLPEDIQCVLVVADAAAHVVNLHSVIILLRHIQQAVGIVVSHSLGGVETCLRCRARCTGPGGLSEHMPRVHAVRNACGKIVNDHSVDTGVRREQAFVRLVIRNTLHCKQSDLGVTRHSCREVCLPQHPDGVFAVGNGCNVEDRDAVAGVLSHKENTAAQRQAGRRIQTCL